MNSVIKYLRLSTWTHGRWQIIHEGQPASSKVGSRSSTRDLKPTVYMPSELSEHSSQWRPVRYSIALLFSYFRQSEQRVKMIIVSTRFFGQQYAFILTRLDFFISGTDLGVRGSPCINITSWMANSRFSFISPSSLQVIKHHEMQCECKQESGPLTSPLNLSRQWVQYHLPWG